MDDEVARGKPRISFSKHLSELLGVLYWRCIGPAPHARFAFQPLFNRFLARAPTEPDAIKTKPHFKTSTGKRSRNDRREICINQHFSNCFAKKAGRDVRDNSQFRYTTRLVLGTKLMMCAQKSNNSKLKKSVIIVVPNISMYLI